jgi:hypothetical protein
MHRKKLPVVGNMDQQFMLLAAPGHIAVPNARLPELPTSPTKVQSFEEWKQERVRSGEWWAVLQEEQRLRETTLNPLGKTQSTTNLGLNELFGRHELFPWHASHFE